MTRYRDAADLPPRYRQQAQRKLAQELRTARVRLLREQSNTERSFTDLVRAQARMRGWHTYHTLHSKGSDAGWPDLVLWRTDTNPGAQHTVTAHAGTYRGSFDEFLSTIDATSDAFLLVRELKLDTTYPTAAQRTWLTMLRLAGVDASVWRPRDWETILATLERPQHAHDQ